MADTVGSKHPVDAIEDVAAHVGEMEAELAQATNVETVDAIRLMWRGEAERARDEHPDVETSHRLNDLRMRLDVAATHRKAQLLGHIE